jgi:hypothetical protein
VAAYRRSRPSRDGGDGGRLRASALLTAALADATAEIHTLRERNAHLQELHAERTRQLLAKNYWIIDHNVRRRAGK